MKNTLQSELSQNNFDDVLLVDKPKGISSFDVIRILRRDLGVRKLGHAGTLDPLASGLMLVGVGAGTKKLHALTGLDKTYRVAILLGKRTVTGDMEGEVLEEKEATQVTQEMIVTAALKLVGTLHLPVPAYSAVKQGGVALYKKARAGKNVVVPYRDMEVYAVRFIAYDIQKHVVELEMDVASGVYVRSVAEKFGELLGLPATVYELRRVKVGNFDVIDAQKLTDYETYIKK
jgi:tRNA pseudouridine55 synthase